jgi:hypothetical protein
LRTRLRNRARITICTTNKSNAYPSLALGQSIPGCRGRFCVVVELWKRRAKNKHRQSRPQHPIWKRAQRHLLTAGTCEWPRSRMGVCPLGGLASIASPIFVSGGGRLTSHVAVGCSLLVCIINSFVSSLVLNVNHIHLGVDSFCSVLSIPSSHLSFRSSSFLSISLISLLLFHSFQLPPLPWNPSPSSNPRSTSSSLDKRHSTRMQRQLAQLSLFDSR